MKYQNEFEHEVNSCGGNRYEAINKLCRKARKLSASVNNTIKQMDSIHWALSNVPPSCLSEAHSISYHEQIMQEYLCQVENESIANSVRTSFLQSVKIGHLVYVYQDDLSDYQEARVRIITNMLWYQLLEERKKN